MASKIRFIKRALEALEPGAGRVWDTGQAGLGLRVSPRGVKSFFVIYRAGRRQRELNLGRFPTLTIDQARRGAREILTKAAAGHDPAAERKAKAAAITLSQFAEKYLADYATVYKKNSSLRNDLCLLRCHILPGLGKKKLNDIRRADVVRLHLKMKGRPYAANRMLALLSKMFNIADNLGYPVKQNPCRGVQRFKERARRRYLSTAELGRLAAVLNAFEESKAVRQSALDAIRFLIFTGCRKNEVLTLRWENVDLERRLLHLHDAKAGPRDVVLNSAASEILKGIKQQQRGGDWVFPGRRPDRPLVGLSKMWERVRAEAKIEDVRIHDLRHTFGSLAAGLQLGLPVIGGLLGHTQAQTTERYAHVADDPLRAASEAVGRKLEELMRDPGGPQIVDIGSAAAKE